MKILFQLVILTGLACASTSAIAQTAATISPEGKVVLPADQPHTDAYVIDISSYNFSTAEEVLEFLNADQSPHVAFRPLMDRNEVMVYLQTKQKPDWTTQKWNQHLQAAKLSEESQTQSKTK